MSKKVRIGLLSTAVGLLIIACISFFIARDYEKPIPMTDLAKDYAGATVDVDGNLLAPFDVVYAEEFQTGQYEYDQNNILLKTDKDYNGKMTHDLSKCGIRSIEKFMDGKDGTWYRAKLNGDAYIHDVIKRVRSLDEVQMADYDYVYREKAVATETETGGAETDGLIFEVIENVLAKEQWYLKSCDIQKSWKFLKDNGISAGGSSSVTVAVIDTGVDYNHPDLKTNMWKNPGETPGNGIDDDNNGYVDDVYGVNVIANNGYADMENVGNPMDDHGHGTHVAGIIAAANNKEGIVGVAYNTKIMAVKAGQATGVFLQSDIAEAILYAYQMGADVINMSFGGSACSIAVQDALSEAYTTSTLVASAGNDGLPNEDYPGRVLRILPNYPGALSYVIGVMSVNALGFESAFTNFDGLLYTPVEYEVYAPGEAIMSTLPNGRYGKLSGTSMATPIVSGAAALLRSYFTDRDMYPSKYIAAQLVATSERQALCVNPDVHNIHNIPMILNVYDAFTKVPKPDVRLYNYYLFDSESIAPENSGDGVVDAGETINIGTVLRNRWGMSKNTIITIDSLSMAGIVNPYVEILTDSVNFDGVGTYSTKDKLIRSEEKIVTGTELPLVVKIKETCPNDYLVKLNVTVTCENALDEKDLSTYTTGGVVEFRVRNGVILPSQIKEDMTLTKDNYYIIPNSTYIAEGVTVTVEPGTNIQFWTDDPDEPYADTYMAYLNVAGKFIVNGSEKEPVKIFPSDMMSDYRVKIVTEKTGVVEINYANVTNPCVFADYVNHCTFRQNYTRPYIYRYFENGVINENSTNGYLNAKRVENSVFYKLGGSQWNDYLFSVNGGNNSYNSISGTYKNCIFVGSAISYGRCDYENCVFLGNNVTHENGNKTVSSIGLNNERITINRICRNDQTGTTYIKVSDVLNIREFAKLLGGDLCAIESEEEKTYLDDNYINGYVGAKFGETTWINGATIKDFVKLSYPDYEYGFYGKMSDDTYNNPDCFIIEIPGEVYCENIVVKEQNVEIDINSKYQVNASSTPFAFDENSLLYVSDDTTVATVDENGVVIPKRKGKVKITVYSPDFREKTECRITVKDKIALQNIKLTAPTLYFNLDERVEITPEFVPSNTTERFVTFKSDNQFIKVNKNGVVTAEKEGSAKITATSENGKTAEITLFAGKALEEIKFNQGLFVTYIGDTSEKWKPELLPQDATNKNLIWESSNPEVAYVDGSGNLVRVSVGNATLRVTEKDSGIFNEITISVADYDLPSMQIRQIADGIWAVMEDNTLWTWGNDTKVPLKVLNNVKSVASDHGYYCYVVTTAGELKYYRISSDNTMYEQKLDFSLTNVNKVISEFVDGFSVFALKNDGTVWAWGDNIYGNLGNGSTTSRDIPVQMNITDVKDIVALSRASIVLCKNGNAYGFGGDGKYTSPVLLREKVDSICGRGDGGILKCKDGSQFCVRDYNSDITSLDKLEFNRNYFSDLAYIENGLANVELYDGNINKWYEYKELNAKKIFVLYNRLCYIITENDEVYGVGFNDNGQIDGFSNQEYILKPIRIPLGMQRDERKPVVENCNIKDNVLTDNFINLDFSLALIDNVSAELRTNNYDYVGTTKEVRLKNLKITPTTPLVNGETYTLTIDNNGVNSKMGVGNDKITYTFTYLSDTKMLLVDKNLSEGDVLTDNNINFNFNYTLALMGDNFNSIEIRKDGIKVENIAVVLENNNLSITGVLPYGKYTLYIPENAIRDNVGGKNSLTEIDFSVESKITLLSSTVKNGETRVDEKKNLAFTFEEGLMGDAFESITLSEKNGASVEITKTLENNVLTIFHAPLLSGKTYIVTIPANAIKNSSNAVNISIVIEFTTYEPTKLVHSSIKDGLVVDRYPVFHFEYNDVTAFDESKVTIFKGNVKIMFTSSVEGNVVNISPAGLDNGKEYTVTLDTGAVTDERGALSEKFTAKVKAITYGERLYFNTENLETYKQKWIDLGYNTNFKNCSILNNLNDTNVQHWLRFMAGEGKGVRNLGNMYWGTTNEDIIGRHIFDFDDNQALFDINEKPFLLNAPETAFPFITDVYLLNSSGERVTVVGNETVTFVVEFNRDMNQTIPLRVRFGSSYPFAEYEIEGKFVNARRWEGTYTLKTTIENGNQFFNIGNGCASDDDFMKLYTFPGRFMFEIDTSSAQAMVMTATATETGVQLGWIQDDFDTLLGYNLYRSTSEDGLYERVNDYVLDPSTKEFLDKNVEPGTMYYYNFTVVKTDLTESSPSGKTMVVSYDTMAPDIYHSPVRTGFTGSNILVHATITDNLNIDHASLFYRVNGTTEWKSVVMHSLNSRYTGVIPVNDVTLDGVEYYIDAFDGISHTYKGTNTNPFFITVKTSVDQNSLGDVDGDGVISTKDALMLLQAANDQLNLTAEQFMRADINGDKVLSAVEALRILQYVSGKITTIV